MGLLIPLSILIPIALVVVILIVVAWILYTRNKKLYTRIVSEKKRFSLYKQNIEALKNSAQGPEKDFKTLSKLARAFFKEYLNLNPSLAYLELSEYFKKQNKQDYAKFCKLMSDINYSKPKTKKTEVRQLIGLFSEIINNY